jgi:hypothetical protein
MLSCILVDGFLDLRPAVFFSAAGVITGLFKLLPSGVAGDLFALRDETISMDASSILYFSDLS